MSLKKFLSDVEIELLILFGSGIFLTDQCKLMYSPNYWFRNGFMVIRYTLINIEKQCLVSPKGSPRKKKKKQIYFGFLLNCLGLPSLYIYGPFDEILLAFFQVGKNFSKRLVFVNPPPPFSLENVPT